jgi:hypothetical protein
VAPLETTLAAPLAERVGRPEDDLYPRLLAGVTVSAFRAAFVTWPPETGIEGLRTRVGQAYDHLAAGLPSPRVTPSRPVPG